ncbi:peptidylprolyl isomerase [Cyanobium sp. ATX-6F1]|uniref:peptidylprolyl isomerase n=1 Tax=Cyanobium sp. ATX-6F1 TaxID=3137388 RepID=UPI0039BE0EA2
MNPSQYGLGSFIDPAQGQPRLIPLELSLEGEGEPRYGQEAAGPGESSKLKLVHERGALAMARSQDPNSASAQFYIALRGLPELDGRYAVFGRVIKGMDVVDRIQQGDKITRARLLEGALWSRASPETPEALCGSPVQVGTRLSEAITLR